MQEEVKKAVASCKNELNITDELTYDKHFKEPVTQELKCFWKCYGEKLGLIVDKKVNWDQVVSTNEKLYNKNEETKKLALKATYTCKNSVPEVPDLCEYSFDLSKCMYTEIDKNRVQCGQDEK
uniref:Odorant-binding protein 2 n=1 Tax=Triatoma infestans TaxID=30076 RepID=A0A161MLC3_TRIIF